MNVKLMVSYKLHEEISRIYAEYYGNESRIIEAKAKNLVKNYPSIDELSTRQFAELIVNGYGHHPKYTPSDLKDEFRFNESDSNNLEHVVRIVDKIAVVAWDSTGKLETMVYTIDDVLENLNKGYWIIKEEV